MGLVRRIVRSVTRAVGGAIKGAVGFVSKAIGTVTQFAQGVVGNILDKLPFGNLLKGFAQRFLGSPFGLLAASTLGGFGAMLGLAGSFGALRDAARVGCGCQAYEHPCARQNMAAMMAYNQARIMAANGWYC